MWVWQLILPTLVCICIYQRRAVRSATPTTQLSVRSTWLSEVSCVTDDGRGQLHHWNTHHDELQQKYKQLIIFIASWWYFTVSLHNPNYLLTLAYVATSEIRNPLWLCAGRKWTPFHSGRSRRFSCLDKLSSLPISVALGYKAAFRITSLWGYVYGLEHIQPIVGTLWLTSPFSGVSTRPLLGWHPH